MKKFLFLGGGIALCLISVFAAILCWRVFQEMQSSSSWPKTPGTINVSQLEDLPSVRASKKKAKVEYSYSVDGQSYSGSRIRFADTTGNSPSMQQSLLTPYPVGKQVDVYYDPGKPSASVLEPGGGLRAFALILPPLIVMGVGGYLITAGIRL